MRTRRVLSITSYRQSVDGITLYADKITELIERNEEFEVLSTAVANGVNFKSKFIKAETDDYTL